MNNTEASKRGVYLVNKTHRSQSESHLCASCISCEFVMPSETSSTGLRCGHQYFLVMPFLRKVTRMDHFPEVSAIHACEHWCEKQFVKTA